MPSAKTPGTPAREFEARIQRTQDWRSATLSHLRDLIRQADSQVVEELKWKKPSNPSGEPVWSHDGIICVGNTLKASVRLTFPKGASLRDPAKLFNSRLDSRTVRAVDVFEGQTIAAGALKDLIIQAVQLNASTVGRRPPRSSARR